MTYIGQKPGSNFRDVITKDSITGDGSTVVFDLTKSFNQACQNEKMHGWALQQDTLMGKIPVFDYFLTFLDKKSVIKKNLRICKRY